MAPLFARADFQVLGVVQLALRPADLENRVRVEGYGEGVPKIRIALESSDSVSAGLGAARASGAGRGRAAVDGRVLPSDHGIEFRRRSGHRFGGLRERGAWPVGAAGAGHPR